MHDDQNFDALNRPTADLDPFGSGWGNRYIDDLILRRIDRDLDDEYDEAWYHLTDVQFSTVAVTEPRTGLNARVHERVTYDAYGRARHHWGHDVNGDGAITTSGGGTDLSIITAIVLGGGATITDATYRAEADINRDGVINENDELALGSAKKARDPGEISDRTSTGPDSIIGWCGYVFVPETRFYHVRFRVYDTGLGRWKSRDPLGYVDGMGVYEYVNSDSVVGMDPTGLRQHFARRTVRYNCSDLEIAQRRGPKRILSQVTVRQRASSIPTPDGIVGVILALMGEVGAFDLSVSVRVSSLSGREWLNKQCKCTWQYDIQLCQTCCERRQVQSMHTGEWRTTSTRSGVRRCQWRRCYAYTYGHVVGSAAPGRRHNFTALVCSCMDPVQFEAELSAFARRQSRSLSASDLERLELMRKMTCQDWLRALEDGTS